MAEVDLRDLLFVLKQIEKRSEYIERYLESIDKTLKSELDEGRVKEI